MPAIFYYGGLFIAVWVEAARLGITSIPKEEREVLTREDGIKSLMFFVPVIVIIGVLVTGRSPASAGLWATVAGVVMGFINPIVRKRPQIFIDALAKGGEQCARIMVAVAAIGIIVGVMNLTGLGIRFSNMVLAFAGTNLFFALVLMALASLVLGMGLPTIPAYVIIVIIMGGAIEKLGVPKMLVHLFVVYFGVLSAITPPVAIAAYAAAPIAKANPMNTAMQALKLSSVGFMIPFVLIYNPSLSLVYNFEVIAFVSVVIRLALAIWLVTTALGGVDRAPLPVYSRILRITLGVVILLTYIEVQIAGIIASLILLYVDSKRAKSTIPSTPT
jgi:TRAP transporter 4TM/12TM fusion protein